MHVSLDSKIALIYNIKILVVYKQIFKVIVQSTKGSKL